MLGTKDLYEDTDLMPSIEPLQADMGYAQSKWVAEKILEIAKLRGLRVNIFRPGFIFCDGQTGLCNTADFMVRCTTACIKLGYYPLLHNQCKEMLTVDFASAAILQLTKDERHLNKNYHLVRHDIKKQPSITDYFEMLRKLGYDLRAVEFRDWVDMLSRACMEEEKHPMLPLMPMMAETIREDRTRWEMYDDMPAIHCNNLHTGLQGSGVSFTNIDESLLEKYVDYLGNKGLVPSREDLDQPVDRMTMRLTMKARRESSARFKYRPSGRRMTRLSAFLSEAGADRKSLYFSAGDGSTRSLSASNRDHPYVASIDSPNGASRNNPNGSTNGSTGRPGIFQHTDPLQSSPALHISGGRKVVGRISRASPRVSAVRALRLSRLQGSICESFREESRVSGGKADFSVQALIRNEFDDLEEEHEQWPIDNERLESNKDEHNLLDGMVESTRKVSISTDEYPDKISLSNGRDSASSTQTLNREMEIGKIEEETDEDLDEVDANKVLRKKESGESVNQESLKPGLGRGEVRSG